MERKWAVLPREEQIALELRTLFDGQGYQLFRLSSFEEYDFYNQNRTFLAGDDVITFTGSDGRLMALKPDVTLSIVKNTPAGKNRKVYYNEDVYRHDRKNDEYQRLNQIGLEVIGKITLETEVEVLTLALESLATVGPAALDLSHSEIITAILEQFPEGATRQLAVKALQTKSPDDLQDAAKQAELSADLTQCLLALTSLTGDFLAVYQEAWKLTATLPKARGGLRALLEVYEALVKADNIPENVNIHLDLSIVNDTTYYSGMLFQGFVSEVPHGILFGGRYDGLLTAQGKEQGAVGFGLHLNDLNQQQQPEVLATDSWLNVALPKGRMGQQVYQLFQDAQLCRKDLFDDSRKLVFEDANRRLRFFLVKPSDVDSYVEHGAADIGIVGRDVLLESEAEVLDLWRMDLGKCRIAVAGKKEFQLDPTRPLRVATKYPNITRTYYSQCSQAVELIQLHGSIELAPIVGLADVIVDIVETGSTLRENNLTILEEITTSSARLIVNPMAWRFKKAGIQEIVEKMRDVSDENN